MTEYDRQHTVTCSGSREEGRSHLSISILILYFKFINCNYGRALFKLLCHCGSLVCACLPSLSLSRCHWCAVITFNTVVEVVSVCMNEQRGNSCINLLATDFFFSNFSTHCI